MRGWCAVEFVGDEDTGEDRSFAERQVTGLGVIDLAADDVGWQQVSGALHALKRQVDAARQCAREQRLAHPRSVLDQEVAAWRVGS